MTTWKNLTRAQKLDLYKRHYQNYEKYTDLATEIGMPVPSLRRNLRDFKILAGINPKASLPSEKPLPANDDLFDILRKGPISLRDISRRFDRSPDTIRKLIEDMKKEGYIIEKSRLGIIIDTQKHPKVDYKPAKTLADEAGYDIAFAVASDLQAGSNCCQPSSLIILSKRLMKSMVYVMSSVLGISRLEFGGIRVMQLIWFLPFVRVKLYHHQWLPLFKSG